MGLGKAISLQLMGPEQELFQWFMVPKMNLFLGPDISKNRADSGSRNRFMLVISESSDEQFSLFCLEACIKDFVLFFLNVSCFGYVEYKNNLNFRYLF